jgi:hypothetical protein
MKEKVNRRRSGLVAEQDKPRTGKKGARGQDEGRWSKRSAKNTIANNRKKPGRQKQTAALKVEQAKRARSMGVASR